MPRSFLPTALPPAANLATAAARRRLRRLAAGVRIDLGVEHQDVDVAAGGQHVVQAAEADVVGPAVAADDPDAPADQGVGHRRPVPVPPASRFPPDRCFNAATRARCGRRSRSSVRLVASSMPSTRSSPNSRRRHPLSKLPGVFVLLIDGQPQCPGRTRRCPRTASWTRPARGRRRSGPRRGGQVAAVDRRAAGGVGDHDRGRRRAGSSA